MRDLFHEPQFDSHIDDDHVVCPYCKSTYQPESEDYSEDTREEECSECGKKFYLHQCFSVDHRTRPDCELNGSEHEWDTVHNHPDNQSCGICNKWRSTPKQSPSGNESGSCK